MYEIVNIKTRESMGVFATVATAERWIRSHGNPADFRILPW